MGCCVTEIVGTVDARVLRGCLFLHFLDKVIKIAINWVVINIKASAPDFTVLS